MKLRLIAVAMENVEDELSKGNCRLATLDESLIWKEKTGRRFIDFSLKPFCVLAINIDDDQPPVN